MKRVLALIWLAILALLAIATLAYQGTRGDCCTAPPFEEVR